MSDSVFWLWRDAIISRRGFGSQKSVNRRIFIDRSAFADDDSIRSYYDYGVERGLGIALRVFCVASDVSLCYIYIPEDKITAEYAMMSSLKCSTPEPCPSATFVNSRLVARILRFLLRVPDTPWIAKEVPLRPAHSRSDE